MKNWIVLCSQLQFCNFLILTFYINDNFFLGFSSTGGGTRCSECAKGKYSNSPGSAPCKSCDSNTYSETEGEISCKECPSGYKSASTFCIEAATDTTLPVPDNVVVFTVSASSSANNANISWTPPTTNLGRVKWLEIQWSSKNKFVTGKDTEFQLLPGSALASGLHVVNLGSGNNSQWGPLWQQVLYIRLRTVSDDARHSMWSTVTLPWRTASECSPTQFLNTVFDEATLLEPLSWRCQDCPLGSYCEGDILYTDVIPLFGYWRAPKKVESEIVPHVFVECPFAAGSLATFFGSGFV